MLKEKISLTLIFLTSLIFLGIDISEDISHGSPLDHIAKEILIVLLGIIGVLIVWHKYFVFKRKSENLSLSLGEAEEQLRQFKIKTKALYEGLNQSIDEQFKLWQLTEAERDVANLILKGMSNKEIAEARASSEKTVTLQLNSVYKKSHLKNRGELAAYFLDALFPNPA
jgi:DNA-binding CsgD family transcriptional regulator